MRQRFNGSRWGGLGSVLGCGAIISPPKRQIIRNGSLVLVVHRVMEAEEWWDLPCV